MAEHPPDQEQEASNPADQVPKRPKKTTQGAIITTGAARPLNRDRFSHPYGACRRGNCLEWLSIHPLES